jgi:hypothetical protein
MDVDRYSLYVEVSADDQVIVLPSMVELGVGWQVLKKNLEIG